MFSCLVLALLTERCTLCELVLDLSWGFGLGIDGSMSTKDTHASGPPTEIEMFHSAPANKCVFTRQQKPKQLVAIRIHTLHTHAHTGVVSSNIIEVWQ